jgi:phage repressor protein C with HTH and peptisase S24 domain
MADSHEIEQENTVGSRFKDVLLRLKIDRKIRREGEIASANGYSPATISEIKADRQEPPEKILNFLKTKFNVNIDYIERGDGEIYLSKQFDNENSGPGSYLDNRRVIKNSDEPYLVPYVDLPAQAGYTKAYQQIDFINTLKRYPILPDVDATGAIWRYFQVAGDSMEPEIMQNDILLCSQIPSEDWLELRPKHTHVIVTDENLWIKDVVVEKKQNELWLLSQNSAYEAFSIPISDVRQVWVMRRHVKNRAKKHRMYDMDEVRKQVENRKKKPKH